MSTSENVGGRIVFENDRVRVWDDSVAIGATQKLHTHTKPYLAVAIAGERGETIGPPRVAQYRHDRDLGRDRRVPLAAAISGRGETKSDLARTSFGTGRRHGTHWVCCIGLAGAVYQGRCGMVRRRVKPIWGTAAALVAVLSIAGQTSIAASGGPTNTLTGTVLIPGGSPLGGASVWLHALASRRPKGPVADTLIGNTKTDALGNFSLTIPAKPELIRLASENNGVLNMQLWISGASKAAARPASDGQVLSSEAALSGHQGTLAGKSLGIGRSVASTSFVAVQALSAVAVDGGNRGHGTAFSAPNGVKLYATGVQKSVRNSSDPQPCPTPQPPGPWTVIDEDYFFEPVGELHIYWDGTAKFSYGKTGDSDMGVGYSYSRGPWSVNGTVHVGNSHSKEVDISGFSPSALPEQPFGRRVMVKFHYYYERSSQGGNCNVVDRIRAVDWVPSILNGQDVTSRDGYNRANYVWQHCAGGRPEACFGEFGPRAHFHRSESRAAKYSVGVSAFGVQLSAQSGYSTMVEMDWTFGAQNYTHYLFYDKPPFDSAPNVYSY